MIHLPKTIAKKKIILASLVTLGIAIPTKIAYLQYSGSYHSDLTAKVYNDTTNNNVNIVFYKEGCPYCQAGMSKIKNEAKNSNVTTFYVDGSTTEGKTLAKRLGVTKAATIVKIRNGDISSGYYAYDDKEGNITADESYIKEVFEN